MAGPFVHLAAMEQVHTLAEQALKIPIITGDKIEVMEPDISGNGASWDVVHGSGNLFRSLEDLSGRMSDMFRVCNKDINKLNIPLYSKHVRNICHYIMDCHTLGHMSSEMHKLETRLEPLGEFVWRKKSLGISLPSFNNYDEYKTNLIKSMKYIHDTYAKSAQSWKFIISRNFRKLIRETVKTSAEHTVALIKISLDNA